MNELTIEYKEFKKSFFEKILKEKPEFIRKGQALFNYLYDINPNLANKIRATSVDCFYHDIRISNTLEYLEKNWE